MLSKKEVVVMKQNAAKLPTETSIRVENVKLHALVALSPEEKQARPDREEFMHKHVFYELFFCKKGEFSIETSDGIILLRAGDLAIIPPTQTHVLRRTAPRTEGYIIPFLCKKIREEGAVDLYKKLTRIINQEPLILTNRPEVVEKADAIVREALSGNTERLLTALHLLELFLQIASAEAEPQTDKQSHGGLISNDIQSMMALDMLIARRYLQNYTAADYAKELFISTRQLDRIVIKRYGKSLHRLIADRRLALAEQMLLTSELTVEEVASRTGFSSTASLYRAFKKHRGLTPSEVRRKEKS